MAKNRNKKTKKARAVSMDIPDATVSDVPQAMAKNRNKKTKKDQAVSMDIPDATVSDVPQAMAKNRNKKTKKDRAVPMDIPDATVSDVPQAMAKNRNKKTKKDRAVSMDIPDATVSDVPQAMDTSEPSASLSAAGVLIRMSSQPSSSQATSRNTHEPLPPANTRYLIHVAADGTVGGRDAGKWSSRCGALIRAHVPIHYTDWRCIPKNFKDDVWTALMNEFELNIPPNVARSLDLEAKFPQFLRTEKHELRKNYIRKVKTKREAIANRPNDIDVVCWEKFVDNEFSEKKRQQCKKNAENKRYNTITHALGRRSYSQLYETIENANPGEPVKRSTVWKVARTSKKTGEVLPSAKEAFEKIEAVEKKRKAASSSQHSSAAAMVDIEHDELAEVFGPDRKDRCRAMSSNFSMKKVKHGKAAKYIAEQTSDAKISEFQKAIQDQVKSAVNELKEAAGTIFLGMNQFCRPQSFEGNTLRTEGASNMEKELQIQPQNLNNAFDALATSVPYSRNRDTSQSEKQYVMLLSRERTEVAKGYIHKRSGVWHMKKVEDDERVVFVTEVKDPEAMIYEAPQMGHFKLCEIADGGFLIWLQSRLRYL